MTTMIKTGARPAVPKREHPSTGLTFTPSGHRYRLTERPGPKTKDNPALPVTGVTTLIGGGVPKDALPYWYAKTVAEYVEGKLANGELDGMRAGLGYDGFIRDLASRPAKIRDAAGVRGTAVHNFGEQLARTGSVDDVPPELMGYVQGYAEFLDRWQITPVLMERPVGNRKDWWAGTFDLLCTSPLLAGGELVQVDLKTPKRVYGETGLQTAAYSRAEFYVDADGYEVPLPKVHATYVAHVTPLDRDGENERYGEAPLGTSLYRLAGSPAEIDTQYQMFLAAAYTHKTKKMRDAIITEPLEPNTNITEGKQEAA